MPEATETKFCQLRIVQYLMWEKADVTDEGHPFLLNTDTEGLKWPQTRQIKLIWGWVVCLKHDRVHDCNKCKHICIRLLNELVQPLCDSYHLTKMQFSSKPCRGRRGWNTDVCVCVCVCKIKIEAHRKMYAGLSFCFGCEMGPGWEAEDQRVYWGEGEQWSEHGLVFRLKVYL